MKSLRNLRLIGVALLGLTLVGTAGFHFIEGWPWFDGFYMVITTFTTIGYQEIHPLSHAGTHLQHRPDHCRRVAGVSRHRVTDAGFARIRADAASSEGEKWSAKSAGFPIITSSAAPDAWVAARPASWPRKHVAVRHRRSERRQRAATCEGDWLTLVGDATQGQILRDAHIERARGLVAATTTDATNLYIVLTARELNPQLRIIARASEEDAEKRLLKAGADSVVLPYLFAGQRIARSFLQPHVVSFLDSATTHLDMDLEIGEICVANASAVAGKTIETSRIRQDRGASDSGHQAGKGNAI